MLLTTDAARLVQHRTAEAFDPELQRWHALSGQMATERKYCAAAVLGGRLYVAGGMNEQRHRLAEVEAYDPREGKWQRVGPMQVGIFVGCANAKLGLGCFV